MSTRLLGPEHVPSNETLPKGRPGCGTLLFNAAKALAVVAALGGGATATYVGRRELASAAFQEVAPTVLDGWVARDAEVAVFEATKAEAVKAAGEVLATFEKSVIDAAPSRYEAIEAERNEAVANVNQTVSAQQSAVRTRESNDLALVEEWNVKALDLKLGGSGAMERVLNPRFMTLDANNDQVMELDRQGLATMLKQAPYSDLVACEGKIPQMVTVNSQGEEVSSLSSNAREAIATLEGFETIVTGCADSAKYFLNTKYDAQVAAITRDTVMAGIEGEYDGTLLLGVSSPDFIGRVRVGMGGAAQDRMYKEAVSTAETTLASATAEADLKVTDTLAYKAFQVLRPEGWASISGPKVTDFSIDRAQELACPSEEDGLSTPVLQVNCDGALPEYTIFDCVSQTDGVEPTGLVVKDSVGLEGYSAKISSLAFSPTDLCSYTGQGAWKTNL